MFGRTRLSRDPFEGTGAKRLQRRQFVEGLVALALAIVACGLTTAMWLRTLEPLFRRIAIG